MTAMTPDLWGSLPTEERDRLQALALARYSRRVRVHKHHGTWYVAIGDVEMPFRSFKCAINFVRRNVK